MSPSSGCLGWLAVWKEQPKHGAGGLLEAVGSDTGDGPGEALLLGGRGPGPGAGLSEGGSRSDAKGPLEAPTAHPSGFLLRLSCLVPSPALGHRRVLLFYEDEAPGAFGTPTGVPILCL